MLGQFLALLSAAAFAAQGVSIRRAVFRTGDPNTALFISIFVGTLIFSLLLAFSGNAGQLATSSWYGLVCLAGGGIVNFVIGRGLFFRALQLVGANLASPLLNSSIVVAVIMGITLMEEPITLGSALGVTFIVIGVVAISTESGGAKKPDSIVTRGNMVKGIASALSAGVFYGISTVLVKVGIREGNSPITATFVAYAAAMLVILGILLRSRERRQLREVDHAAIAPILLGSVLVSMAQLCRSWALDYSPVSVVQPLISISVLFTILFSFAVNRGIELFTRRVIAATLFVVSGAFLIFQV